MPHWRPSTNSAQCFRRTSAFGTVVGAALGIALTPVLAPAFLGILGFGAAEPVAGQFPLQTNVTSDPSEPLGSIAAAGAGDAAIPIVISVIVAAFGAGGGAGPDDEDPNEA